MTHARTGILGTAIGTLALSLVLAACGGADPTATPRPAPTSIATPQATPTPPRPTPTQAAAAATPTPAQAVATPTRPVGAQPTTAPTAPPAATPRPTATPLPAVDVGAGPIPGARYGGTLKRRLGTEAATWDIRREQTQDMHDAVTPTYDQVVFANPQKPGDMLPQLASSWAISNGGLTYTFKLRPGIKFHNGNALTAQDVKYTMELVLKPPQGVTSSYKALLEPVKSIATPDDLTVVIDLSLADASFLSSFGFGRMGIYDKELIEAEGLDRMTKWPPMGTGPYMGRPGSYVKGVSVEIYKNDKYYMPGRPFLEGMKFFIIPDVGTTFAAFLTGQINFGMNLSLSQSKEATQRLGNRVFIQKTPSLTHQQMQLNTRLKPFDDIRVREAVALAISKTGMREVVSQGQGTISGHLPPGSGWDLSEQELSLISGYGTDRKANIAKAKDLLAKAGYPSGVEISYLVRNHPAYIDLNVYIKADLEEIGIRGKLNILETAQYFEIRDQPTTWQVLANGANHPDADPNPIYRRAALPGGNTNRGGLNDAKLVELFNAQAAEPDVAKRKLGVKAMEKHFLTQYAHIYFYHQVAEYAWYANIKNYQYHLIAQANQQFRDVWIE